jgi:hypothetical protein
MAGRSYSEAHLSLGKIMSELEDLKKRNKHLSALLKEAVQLLDRYKGILKQSAKSPPPKKKKAAGKSTAKKKVAKKARA